MFYIYIKFNLVYAKKKIRMRMEHSDKSECSIRILIFILFKSFFF